ncbi:MAG: hypothetical protein ACREN6_11400 [Gemmatimonadaceae bacterium]
MSAPFDGLADVSASRLVAWMERAVDDSRTEWIAAMKAELNHMETGWQRLRWAISGLPLLWTFRSRSVQRGAALAGSAAMSNEMPLAPQRLQGRDLFVVISGLCLSVVVVGYSVFLLPVFQNMMASVDQSLNVRGLDFAKLGVWVAKGAGLAFLCGLFYVVSRPRADRARPMTTLVGIMSALLGASAVMLGVTLVRFVLLLLPAMTSESRGSEQVQIALYQLATVNAPGGGSAEAQRTGAEKRITALAAVVHAELVASPYYIGRGVGRVAEPSANELLAALPMFTKNEHYGDAVQDANLLAGIVAFEKHEYAVLEKPRFADAKKFLMAAGATPGSPNLDTAGPNMSLAFRLLQAGERQTVLDYLAEVRGFWKNDGGRLDAWTNEINAGKIPDFGSQLLR